ncbi:MULTISPECIES: hypothetical protein [unclassified Microcoleus]|uniref:hypothetical protein n=1 Tax=unclassified Microcoleus TaxID=2642155 RepID=UPI002FD12EB3
MNQIQNLAIVPFTFTAICSICPYALAETFPRMPVILSQAQYNLTGQWELEAGWFTADVVCLIGSNKVEKSTVDITQNGNQFTANGSGSIFRFFRTLALGLGNGIISENKFQAEDRTYRLQWLGSISNDGNEITGSITCDQKVSLPFIMRRLTTNNPPSSSNWSW